MNILNSSVALHFTVIIFLDTRCTEGSKVLLVIKFFTTFHYLRLKIIE